MSGLRRCRDRLVVAGAAWAQDRVRLLEAWRDDHARSLDADVLTPLLHRTNQLERAVTRADEEVDAALRVLCDLGARL